MARAFWSEFAILLAAALLGSLAIIPYSVRLLTSSQHKPLLKFPLPTRLLLSFLQTAVLSALAIGIGLSAAHAIGLGAPYIEAGLASTGSKQAIVQMLLPSIGLGVLGGAVLLLLDLFFLAYWPPELVDFAQRTTLWENFLASFYGGINEEIFIRLFGFSVLTWLLSRVWHTPAGLPTDAVLWTGNVIVAVLFALGHLPATKNLLGSIPPPMLVRALLLNTPIGLICGWLFWTYGIEAAVLAHFFADIVYHVAGTIVLRSKLLRKA
jgi:Type II CAAX prenyl endopeptidase Rce1-like